MIGIDTSVWIAGLVSGDAHHAATQQWFARFELQETRISVPSLFLAEVAGVLSRTGATDAFVVTVIADIGESEQFDIYPVSIELALASANIARSARIRGSDAVFLALAQSLDVPLVTWDRQQRERGRIICRTMTPVEAMEMAE